MVGAAYQRPFVKTRSLADASYVGDLGLRDATYFSVTFDGVGLPRTDFGQKYYRVFLDLLVQSFSLNYWFSGKPRYFPYLNPMQAEDSSRAFVENNYESGRPQHR